jgi:puromycin-sensitive aminopeptidase
MRVKPTLGATDIYGVLVDAYALWMAGKPRLVSLLHLISVYKGETEYVVLAHVTTTSLHIDEMMVVATLKDLVSLRNFLIDLL